MRGLWLWLFPLLYLPNLGFASQTAFGTLEISDFLIGPYIVLVSLGVWKDPYRRNYSRLTPWLIGFVFAASVSTLTIWLRYPEATDYAMQFGLLKLGKLSVYGMAGVLTARALANPHFREHYDWALLGGAVLVAVSLFSNDVPQGVAAPEGGYSSANAISVAMAILLTFLVARLVTGHSRRAWRIAVLALMPVLIIGFSLSNGRGGWLAAIVGVGYLYLRTRFSWKSVGLMTVGVCSLAVAYTKYPTFREDVDRTLWPDKEYLNRYGAGVAGIDDGARLTTWANELGKFPQAALVGAGFFHRGGASPLWTTGSHNFWLQMLLETGIIGFIILGGGVWVIVRQTREPISAELAVPTQTALIATFVGGLGGEYLYGGMVLFTVLAIYAPIGSLLARQSQSATTHQALKHRDATLPPLRTI